MGLGRVDREIRIHQMRDRIEEIAGEYLASGEMPDLPQELEEAFWDHVLEMEDSTFGVPFDTLRADGLAMLPPDELDDASVKDALWEVIRACAKHHLFFHHTDHLSDRELYAYLWEDGLRHVMMGFGILSGNVHLDIIGGGSNEDIILGQRFYDDDEMRKYWAEHYPDDPLPPREKPPYDRDKDLPKAYGDGYC